MAKITIHGLAGTGTTSVGKELARALGYKFLSTGDVFRKKAKELGIEFYKFEKICLKNPKYDLELDDRIARFGKDNDNFIVESRLAYHFIPNSIKIKFTCDYFVRVKRVAQRDGITVSKASEKTNFREQSAKKRYRGYYGIKKLAPDEKFDLIINTSHMSPEKVMERIISKFNLFRKVDSFGEKRS